MIAERLLNQIEAQVARAREALADEDEGKFTRAIRFIEVDADELAELVRKW